MRKLGYVSLAVAAALLLSSCVEWRIGQKIRETKLTHSALLLKTPLGGALYEMEKAPPQGEEKRWAFFFDRGYADCCYYAHVPVVEYRHSSNVLHWELPYASSGYSLTEQKPTGRTRLIALHGHKLYLMPEGATLPKGARRVEAAQLPRSTGRDEPAAGEEEAQPYKIATRREPGHGLAVAVAAPFDYLIDPALSLVSTPVACTVAAVYLGAAGLGELLISPFRPSSTESEAQHSEKP